MSSADPSPAPVTGRRPSREEVRRSLLDAAAEVFAQRGIDGASLDDVAAAAGFTKGAVYSNFASKAGLVDALIADRNSAYLDQGLAAVAGPGRTLGDKARALGDRLTSATDEQRAWHLLFSELWQREVRSPSPDGAGLRARRTELRAQIAEAITAQAEETGTPLRMTAEDLATVVMALANGLATERLLAPDEVPDDLMGKVLAALTGA